LFRRIKRNYGSIAIKNTSKSKVQINTYKSKGPQKTKENRKRRNRHREEERKWWGCVCWRADLLEDESGKQPAIALKE